MARFGFNAVNREGEERSGFLDAGDLASVAELLRNDGWFPTAVWPAGAGESRASARGESGAERKPARMARAAVSPARSRRRSWSLKRTGTWTWRRSLPAAQLAVFTRQLATLLSAGLPLARALQVLERQQRNDAFRETLGVVLRDVGAGKDFSAALREHARMFPPLYSAVARAGEASGSLGEVLQQLATLLEKSERLKSRVRAALCYPVVVSVVTAAIVVGLLLFVVPKFEVIFADLLRGAPLPALTRGVLAVSDAVRAHAFLLAGAGLVLGVAATRIRRTKVWQRCQLALPVFGQLIRKSAVARGARTMGTLLGGGVPILQALTLARETLGNAALADVFTEAHDRVRDGQPLSGTLAASKAFPAMAASMVEVGEETGELPQMLERVAETYDAEVEAAAAGLTSVIEPVLIVVLAVIVGTIVIALFLPIIRILQTLSG